MKDYKSIKHLVDPFLEIAAKNRTNLGDDSTKTEKMDVKREEKRLYRECIKEHPETKEFLNELIKTMD